jgi:hypothetical protein
LIRSRALKRKRPPSVGSLGLTTAFAPAVDLDRRARDGTVRAEHATVACLGLEALAAAFAVIKELAGIGRHRLDGPMAALRAGDD